MTRHWQVLTVTPLGRGRYRVEYLLDRREKRYAIINDILGLDRAITGMGKMLAEQPPLRAPKIGG